MTVEESRAKAWRLTDTYRRLVNDGHHNGKVWKLYREGKRTEALLLDRGARTAAVVAFYQSLDIPVEIIEKEIEAYDR